MTVYAVAEPRRLAFFILFAVFHEAREDVATLTQYLSRLYQISSLKKLYFGA